MGKPSSQVQHTHPPIPQIPQINKPWFVYLLECNDGSFYTGITNNLNKRMKIQKKGKGSKYVKIKKFKKLLKTKKCKSKSDAYKIEYKIKKLPRKEKLNWFN